MPQSVPLMTPVAKCLMAVVTGPVSAQQFRAAWEVGHPHPHLVAAEEVEVAAEEVEVAAEEVVAAAIAPVSLFRILVTIIAYQPLAVLRVDPVVKLLVVEVAAEEVEVVPGVLAARAAGMVNKPVAAGKKDHVARPAGTRHPLPIYLHLAMAQ